MTFLIQNGGSHEGYSRKGKPMSLEAIATEPVKEKLRNLYDHLRHPHPRIYEFGAFLAERLPDTVTPS